MVHYSLGATNTTSLPGAPGFGGFSRPLRAIITPLIAPPGITNFGVAIGQLASQANDTLPKLVDTQPFQARFWAYGAAITNQIQNATWLKPDGVSSVPLLKDGNSQFLLAQGFADAAALQAACPPGNYMLESQLEGDCATLAALQLGAAAFPALPQVSGLMALQAADSTQPLDIQWAPWTGGVARAGCLGPACHQSHHSREHVPARPGVHVRTRLFPLDHAANWGIARRHRLGRRV